MVQLDVSPDLRATRRQAERLVILAVAALIAGAFVGLVFLGWTLFPSHARITPAELGPDARIDYVALVVDAWSLNHDADLARERLSGLDPAEVASILSDLNLQRRQSDDPGAADRVASFSSALAIDVRGGVNAASAPDARVRPTNQPQPRLALDPALPGTIRLAVQEWANAQNAILALPGETADLHVTLQPSAGAIPLAERVYVVVDRMATLRTGISSADLRALWGGASTPGGVRSLLLTPDAAEMLTPLLGRPGPAVRTLEFDALVARLWSDPAALGVVAFDALTPRLLALPIDGQSALARDADLGAYPLIARAYVSGESRAAQRAVIALRAIIPRTNREPERMTTLIMSGTTAIARSLAWKMEQKKDYAWGARLVAPVLAQADLVHVSNEAPFVDGCAPVLETMTFCSKPAYIETLKAAGVNLVGLTGNHILDYGAAAFVKTLDAYDAAGMRYFGGGRNEREAGRPLIVEDHGNRIALIGANSFGPRSAWATAQQAGAWRYDAAGLAAAIQAARAQADVVLVEIQGEETYDYAPSANNQILFRATLKAGADVVTGVMAHHPQAVEFGPNGRGLILYGLGNLFFDQIFDLGVRQGMVARHTLYRGRLIQTELLPLMRNDEYQARWATAAERDALLRAVYGASEIK